MKTENARELIDFIDERAKAKSSLAAFELAYQARVAVERIRFAIKELERTTVDSASARGIDLQLLDALDRLQSAEHHFQQTFRRLPGLDQPTGSGAGSSMNQPSSPVEQREVRHA